MSDLLKQLNEALAGRYALERKLGEGGMASVFLAHDEKHDRKVAVKLLRGAESDDLRRARLVREAQALARVSHPNVIHVYEVGEFRGQVFVAMEFVRGSTLESVAIALDCMGEAPEVRERLMALFRKQVELMAEHGLKPKRRGRTRRRRRT